MSELDIQINDNKEGSLPDIEVDVRQTFDLDIDKDNIHKKTITKALF